MEWIILIFVLVAARGNAAAASISPAQQPRSILPVQQGRIPTTSIEVHAVNPNLTVAGLTQIQRNVYAPDQYTDTLSMKIHSIVGDGPTITQQQQALLQHGGGGLSASFTNFREFDV